MAGEIRPRTLRVHRPMLEEVNGGRTEIGPMGERRAAARAYEKEPDVFAVSVNGGFGNADIAEVGPTVLVTAQG
ncbi:M81 family metallopeptidase, partial [Acinetobacter baumannii]